MTSEQLWEKKNGIGAVAVVVGVILWLAFLKYGSHEGTRGVGELTYIEFARQTSGRVYEVSVRESDSGARLFREHIGPQIPEKFTNLTTFKKGDRFTVFYTFHNGTGKYSLVSIGELKPGQRPQ